MRALAENRSNVIKTLLVVMPIGKTACTFAF